MFEGRPGVFLLDARLSRCMKGIHPTSKIQLEVPTPSLLDVPRPLPLILNDRVAVVVAVVVVAFWRGDV